jgi:hypothetical protein
MGGALHERPTLTGIEQTLGEAGGVDAPRERVAQLRDQLQRELDHGAQELAQARSGYDHPVLVAAAEHAGQGLVAVAPVPTALRADPEVVDERAWLVVAALVGALVTAGAEGALTAGAALGHLAIAVQGRDADPELVALAFEEQVADIDRLRSRAIAVPAAVIEPDDLKPPIGAAHPLNIALEVARRGGNPADPASIAEHEDAILALQATAQGATRPHDDPDPSKRVARRILQRLDGMGKWGGYHTEFSHLARGFAGNDRALAEAVGEALLSSGLLAEKPSVGQRHVFLNPRRAGDIRALIERGDLPRDLRLP